MTKVAIFAALTLTIALPAISAERPTKGTKPYQAAKSDQQDQTYTEAAQQEQPADVTQIEPAAGADMETPKSEGKSFKEEMRLPRKN